MNKCQKVEVQVQGGVQVPGEEVQVPREEVQAVLEGLKKNSLTNTVEVELVIEYKSMIGKNYRENRMKHSVKLIKCLERL